MIFEYILYPIYVLLWTTSFIYINSFFITIATEWCFWVILLMMRVFSVFSWSWIHITLIRSHHLCNRHWSRINVLCKTATVLKTSWDWAFKCLLNEVWLETKLSEVMLILRFVSIKFIWPFLKFPFLICFFKRFPL